MRVYAVFHLLGWVLTALSAIMLLPAAFAVAVDSIGAVQAFVVPAFTVGFLGGTLILAFRDRRTFSTRWESLLLLGVVWFTVPLAAALPFYTAGVPKGFVAAYFEATSGFTTTGATAITDLSEAPRSIIVWRALLQWAGGLTTLLSLVAILGPLSGSFLLDRQLRVMGRSTHGSVRHMVEALRSILPLYSGLTMACFVALSFSGIPPFDAFCLALSTLSTGGFMPRDGTIELYGSPAAELVLSVFMVFGAVSVIWLRAILQKRWPLVRETREPYWLITVVLTAGLVLTGLSLANAPDVNWVTLFHSLTTGLAAAASVVSTTGFLTSQPAQDVMPFVALLGLAFIGAGRFSTGGGLKIYRVVAMLRQIERELRVLVYPHGVRPSRFGEEQRDNELIRAIWITFAAFVVTVCVVAMAVSASGLVFSAALLASTGAISNIGPVYEMARAANYPNAPTFGAMSPFAHLSLCAGMLLGRVEIFAFLALLNIANWRD